MCIRSSPPPYAMPVQARTEHEIPWIPELQMIVSGHVGSRNWTWRAALSTQIDHWAISPALFSIFLKQQPSEWMWGILFFVCYIYCLFFPVSLLAQTTGSVSKAIHVHCSVHCSILALNSTEYTVSAQWLVTVGMSTEKMGLVEQACNPACSGVWGRRIASSIVSSSLTAQLSKLCLKIKSKKLAGGILISIARDWHTQGLHSVPAQKSNQTKNEPNGKEKDMQTWAILFLVCMPDLIIAFLMACLGLCLSITFIDDI